MQMGGISNRPNMWCFLQFLMKWQRGLFVADVSSSRDGSGEHSIFLFLFFGGESVGVTEEGAAARSRGRGNPPLESGRGCSRDDGKGSGTRVYG